ncbi:MAG TPA: Fe-S protein assembly co-chaperone HscB [Terriglobales bacterium]|nr:Fe-S protein assembly co-chaperone HscB [Terriglobales bacterium]
MQPPRPADYFSFFGLPPKLDLPLATLEREFYKLSRQLHPDVYARAGQEEQEWSLQRSSLLNDAYRTLKDPIRRTAYLLKLEGVQMEEQSQAATELARQTGNQKKQIVPPEMLEEIFELNMQLEEARANRKAGEVDASLQQELEARKRDYEGRLETLGNELKTYWSAWDALIERQERGESVPQQERAAARDPMVGLLNRHSYIRNLVRDVNEVLETGINTVA